MAWAAGNFTRANGITGWVDDANNNIGIEATRHDTQDNDFATGIDNCLNKTGQNSMTGDLNVGGNKVVNTTQIGIGTSSPTTAVHVQSGNQRFFQSGTSSVAAFAASGTAVNLDLVAGQTAYNNNGAAIRLQCSGATDDGAILFSTNLGGTGPGERVRIANTGFVGIGNNGPTVLVDAARNANDTLTRIRLHNANAGSSASTHLDLGNDQNASGSGLFINSSTNTANGGVNCLHLHNGVGPISARVSGSEKIRLDTNNDVILRNGQLFFDTILSSGAGSHFVKWNSTTGLVTYDSSSALIKEQVVDCPYGLNAVAAMQPRKYYRKDDKRHEVGFIADELIAVAPELVSVGAKSLVTGDAADTEQVPVSVSYEKLTAILCKAIQELSAKVEALEAQVQTLQPDTVLG